MDLLAGLAVFVECLDGRIEGGCIYTGIRR
jgi:hypothetical protein